jgi:hypothetical protein
VDMRIILSILNTKIITVHSVRLVKFCEGHNKNEELIECVKLLEKLSECQLLKEDYRVRLVSDCFFIILAPNALGPFLPANQ